MLLKQKVIEQRYRERENVVDLILQKQEWNQDEIIKITKKIHQLLSKVVENDQVEFRGRKTSLTNSALEIIHEMGYKWTKIAGPQFWTYKGKTLYDLNQED